MDKKYEDPREEKIAQYPFDYLQELRRTDPDLMVSLWNAGHFETAISERNAKKAERKIYFRSKSTGQAQTEAWLRDNDSE